MKYIILPICFCSVNRRKIVVTFFEISERVPTMAGVCSPVSFFGCRFADAIPDSTNLRPNWHKLGLEPRFAFDA